MLGFLLTACGGSTKLDKPGLQAAIDSKLLEKCSRPVKLPNRDLTQLDIERFWAKDRAELIKCGLTKEKLVAVLRMKR
jgi:hypothetical protein